MPSTTEDTGVVIRTFKEGAQTTRTLRNIRNTLNESLVRKYGDGAGLFTDALLRQHGLHESQFDYVSQIENTINHKLNDISIDDNANKSEKTIEAIHQEVFASAKKAIGYDMLYRMMKDLYGKDEARRLSGELYDYSLAISDATAILKNYCYSIDASKIVTVGRDFGQLSSGPAKRVSSYVAALVEVVHEMSTHLAGAIAIGSFFLDITHLLIHREDISLDSIKSDARVRKYVENEMQQFVHSVNHLSRNSNECVTIDTEVLTPSGFKKYDELKVGDPIYTWKDGKMEIQETQRVNISHFKGDMHSYSGRDYGQVVTPNHRILRQKFNSSEFELVESSKIFNMQSPLTFPVAFQTTREIDYDISDDWLEFLTIVFCDGSLIKDPHGVAKRVSIFKSNRRFGNDLIMELADRLGLKYTIKKKGSRFPTIERVYYVNVYEFNTENSVKIIELLGGAKTSLPEFFLLLSQRQAKLVIDTWCRFDGFREDDNYGKTKLQCDNPRIQDQVQHLAMLAGYGSSIQNRIVGTNRVATRYVILYQRRVKDSSVRTLIPHDGLVWCPTTENGIVVYRKDGRVFISGNSPFSNLSAFDKKKLANLIADDNMGWYFNQYFYSDANGEQVACAGLTPKEFKEYVVDYIYEIQKIFIDFFDKGDPLSNGMPYRFPVFTVNLSKENGEIVDQEFLDYISKKDIYRYNIFVSEGTKVASCCFDAKQRVMVRGEDKAVRLCSIKEAYEGGYKSVYHLGHWRPCKPIKLPFKNQLYRIVTKDTRVVTATPDHLWPTSDGMNVVDKRTDELKVGDYLRVFTLDDFTDLSNPLATAATNDQIVEIKKVKNSSTSVYCFEMDDASDPYFTLPNGLITHNCRLISDAEMMEMANQSNSFGGVGISLGSHRVVTIDFNRIALETESYEDFIRLLDQRTEDAAKVLAAHKELIILTKNKGLQTFISNGWINMKRMFSTFGLIGLVEAAEKLQKTLIPDPIGDVLRHFNAKVAEMATKHNIIANIEQIPAESMAVRLAKVDRMIFGYGEVPYELYSNQFVPLWSEATLWEKLEADGRYNKLITGGGIVHAQIGEKVSSTQAKEIIQYAVKCGCEHFALNAVYSQCEKGHTSFGKITACPNCGSEKIDYFTRVVGFFTKVSNWNKTRRDWEFDRRTFV